MNDPREVKNSQPIISSFLSSLEFAEGSNSEEYLRIVENKLSSYNSFVRFFVASFTHESDDLYSWVNYADKGSGFALGIRKSGYDTSRWSDVIYSEAEFRRRIESIWDRGLKDFSGCAEGQRENEAAYVAIELQQIGAAHKHSSWANEKEARILVPVFADAPKNGGFELGTDETDFLRDQNINFRSTNRGLKPYLEISIVPPSSSEDETEQILSEIVIGANNTTEREVVEAFLAMNGFKDVKVTKSECEFVM